MGVHVAAPRPEPEVRTAALGRVRLAAIPAWAWVGGIVAASFGGRLLAAAGRVTPYYLPDEYIYPSLARSLAEHGRPAIRGVPVHFPALLEPILTAPIWLFRSDPGFAYAVTQGLHALFFSLAAIPAYLLCRRLGLATWLAVAAGALAVAVPDGVYASSMLADPLAYPLVLAAVYAGICVIDRPTRRAQLAFALFSSLAVLARIQYVVVPVAVLAGELVADRFRIRATLGRLWLSLILLAGPSALLFAVFGRARLLGPYSHPKQAVHGFAILQWAGRDAMLLAYSAGWVIVPGALVGLTCALFRPRRRVEIGFAATTIALAAALLLESAQIADTDSQRFQERYLFALVPLLVAAFGLYVQRGLPRKLPVALLATGLLVLSARIPLAGYAAAHNKDDSPTLWAVLRLESLLGTGNGSLAVALGAAALSGLAALVGVRKLRLGPPLAVAVAIAACVALSVGATSFDTRTSQLLVKNFPQHLDWVDRLGLGRVDLVAPPGARREQLWNTLFWNTSVKRLLLLGSPPIDQFAVGRIRVARDGRMLVAGRVVRRPLLVQTYASTVELTGVTRVRRTPVFDLYRPAGTPRLRLIVAGRYLDRWLAPRGAFTIWTKHPGVLEFELSLPARTQVTPVRLTGPGINRLVRIHPGRKLRLSFPVPGGAGAWSLHYRTSRPGYLSDNRPVSVLASVVRWRT